jgi:tetratricopeptide (TPR) repeat protein
MWRAKASIGAFLALFYLLAGYPRASAAPASPAPAPYSAGELKEIDELIKRFDQFKSAAASYRSTVNGIVRRTYERRRKEMVENYRRQIRENETGERARRMVAITLFEDFLRRYPNDRRWTPDVIFRLAELYFEKSNDEYLQATEKYEGDLKLFDERKLAVAPVPAKQDFSQTIELHRRLIREFPQYRHVDGAYYLLGYCLGEMGQEAKGRQAFLGLVCANRYKAPLVDEVQPATAAPDNSTAPAPKAAMKPTIYDSCTPLRPKSRFNAEAWVRIGEHHFDENELGPATAAYKRVISAGTQENPYYDEALYKLAWTYFRADKFVLAIKQFDALVRYADMEFEKTGKYGSEMRPEAVQYLGVSFAEEDWDGDTVPDKESGLQRIENYYKDRHQEKHVYEVYKRLSDIYFDTERYNDAIRIYKLILDRWPTRPDNPQIQDQVILALERQRKFQEVIKERETFTRRFGKGTDWERANRNNPKALKQARDLEEQALILSAVERHKKGQKLRQEALAGNPALLQHASEQYGLAATAYERYLDRFPTSKNAYEIRYSYASCLYYSQRFLEAAAQFAQVRDSKLDNRYLEESAFSATKAYEEYVGGEVSGGRMTSPPLPKAEAPPPSLTPIAMPDVYKQWQGALDAYAKILPTSAKSPRLRYKAAEIPYRFLQFKEARQRFADIFTTYCGGASTGNPDGIKLAKNAGRAILASYQLEKDLAATKNWAKKLDGGACGIAGTKVLLSGICFKEAEQDMSAKRWDKAAQGFLRCVDADPKGKDAAAALNNAAVCYEESKRFESATRLYERLWQNYRKSQYAGESLWRAAINYNRFFAFDRAVQNFLILADSQQFKDSPHRQTAVLNAANILENDQAYERAARLFLRYSTLAKNTKEAAEAYFRAALIYKKMGDFPNLVKTFRQYSRLYGSVAGLEANNVEAPFRIGEAAQARGDMLTAKKYYRLAIAEFNRRGLKQGSQPAEYAARAAFQLAEQPVSGFLRTAISGDLNKVVREQAKMTKTAQALKAEYDRIFAYKRVRWTLAAIFRSGAIFEHFAKAVGAGYRQAPIPKKLKKLGQDAIDMYQSQLDEALDKQVRPLEEKAKQLYAICVTKAKEFAVSNEYTEAALQRLNAFDPGAYPLLKQPKIEQPME